MYRGQTVEIRASSGSVRVDILKTRGGTPAGELAVRQEDVCRSHYFRR